MSKAQLQRMGYVLHGEDNQVKEQTPKIERNGNTFEEKTEQVPVHKETAMKSDDDSFIEDSPLPSILKKSSRCTKLDASIGNHSRVEISPGLFVKRPSSKSKPKAEPTKDILETSAVGQSEKRHEVVDFSPQMPQLKTINLAQVFKDGKSRPERKKLEVEVKQDDAETPEMPNFKSEEGMLSAKKIKSSSKKMNYEETKENGRQALSDGDSPQLPFLNSQEANIMLSSKKPSKSPFSAPKSPLRHINESFGLDSPEMPNLQTVNLAAVLRNAKGTEL